MQDWISFEGCVVPMEWGESVYTVLPLPDEVYHALKAQNAKRVEIELNDCPFNLALTKAPVIDQVFVYAGKSVLADASIEPGQIIDVRLRKADPNLVELPPDVAAALMRAELTLTWESTPPGKRRGYLHKITSAKRPETRATRILALIETLKSPED